MGFQAAGILAWRKNDAINHGTDEIERLGTIRAVEHLLESLQLAPVEIGQVRSAPTAKGVEFGRHRPTIWPEPGAGRHQNLREEPSGQPWRISCPFAIFRITNPPFRESPA